MNRRSIPGRALAIGSLLLAASACGGTDTVEPVADPTQTIDQPAVVDATALDGVTFDVRRDPG
jgi:hypothetical protein